MASRSRVKGSDYVFDELICYLSNPLFQLPVLSFVEEHCLIFDPSIDDSPMYRQIHDTYKTLIDNLLKSFRKDTGLSDEDIYTAMKDWNTKSQFKDFRSITDLILACEDYAIFVRIMIQKNLELQQQALMMIAQVMGGALPQSLIQDSQSQPHKQGRSVETDEDRVLMAVIEQSKLEYEKEQKKKKKEESDLHIIIAMSKVESAKLEKTMKDEQEKLAETMHNSLSLKEPVPGPMRTSDRDVRQSSVPPPASYQPKRSQASSGPKPMVAQHNIGGAKSPGVSSAAAAAAWLKSAENEFNSSDAHTRAVQKAAANMTGMSDEEYKKRSEFLHQQRDKLMEMKKKEREKQLLSVEKSQPERPASARAARAALKQNIGEGSSSSSAEDEKKLAMRRAIADRLKSELINKK